MDEKKSIKVSLGTTICVFIIFFLVIGIVAMYYFGFVKNNEKISELENKTVALEKDKNQLENQVSSLPTKDTTEEKEQVSVNENVNKEITETDVMKWYSDLGEKLFEEFLSKQKDITSYKINSCNMIYYYDNEFVCSVNYDVKPSGNIEDSQWLAGNGEIVGDWIKGKGVFLSFKKENGNYTYNEEAGQSTSWGLE